MSAVHFDVLGRSDASETVLLSSGLGGLAAFWQPQLPTLTERYRVITYDQRGTGRSPSDLPAGYSIQDMARDVVEVLDASGTARCHFIGHALGGLVGLCLALDAPGRLQSLAIVNGWSRPNPHTTRCFAMRKQVLKGGGPRAYVEAQPIFLYPPTWCVENEEKVRTEVEHGIAHFQGENNLFRRIDALLAFNVQTRLGQVQTPTWVAAAKDDTLVPWTCSRDLAADLPRVSFDLVDTGGHGYTTTAPEVFNTQMQDFLVSPMAQGAAV